MTRVMAGNGEAALGQPGLGVFLQPGGARCMNVRAGS